MAKSKEYMALYRSRLAFGGVDGAASSSAEGAFIGERTVGEILDEAVENGSITYEVDRTSKNVRNDLFAHAALYLDGREFTVLKERTSTVDGVKGGSNVDLLMTDGAYWEVKSPTSKGNKGDDPLHFVEGALENAEHNFRNHPLTEREQTRVVFNCHSTTVPDELIENRVRDELTRHPNIREVLIVHKDGSVNPLP